MCKYDKTLKSENGEILGNLATRNMEIVSKPSTGSKKMKSA
jgi:hypothetical protein